MCVCGCHFVYSAMHPYQVLQTQAVIALTFIAFLDILIFPVHLLACMMLRSLEMEITLLTFRRNLLLKLDII